MSNHKVVSQVQRILGPGDEMIHMPWLLHHCVAVEATAGLHVIQNHSNDTKIGSLAAEQEFTQIRGGAKHVVVVATDVADPSTSDEVADRTLPRGSGTWPEYRGIIRSERTKAELNEHRLTS